MNISKYTLAVLAVLTGLLCLSIQAFAQQTDAKTDTANVYQLDEIIISASRFEESARSVGRNVTVITRNEIEHAMYTNVSDVLAAQQSMHLVGTGQTPGSLQQGFLRNSNSNHSVVMIDGVRISDPSSTDNGIDLSELSLAGVERIEIVRGSHSTLYGSSAIGGIINIITRKKDTPGFNLDLDTRHGTFGSDTYSTVNNAYANVTLDNGFYTDLGVSQNYSHGLDATIDTIAAGFNPQDQDEFRKMDLIGKVGYKTSSADIYASYRSEDQTSDLDQGSFTDDNNAKIDFNRDLFTYGGSYRLSDRFELKYKGAWSDLTRDFVNDSSLVDAEGNYDGIYTETNTEGTLWENELTASYSMGRSRFLLGLGRSGQTMTLRTYTFSRPFNFESTTDLDSLDLKETINSIFVHSDLNGSLLNEAFDSFSLILGARLADHNRFGSHLTYEINPSLQISPAALVFASVTSGFNAPSLYQLNSPEQGFGALTTRGNKNLDPEKSISYELGWKQSIGERVRFGISLFKTKASDVIEYVYLWNGDTTIDNLGPSDYLGDTYINVSRQNINGIEVGLNLQPVSKLTFGGNLTYTHSTLTFSPGDVDESYTGNNHVQVFESGQFVNSKKELDGLTRRPQVSALARISYRPMQKLTVSVSSRFVGSRDDVYYSSALGPYGAQDRSSVDGYNLTDMAIRYEITRQWSVTGKMENIFDTEYTEINGYQTKGRGLFLKASFNL